MLHLRSSAETTPPLTAAFNCRRVLENTDHYLVEVKRNNDRNFLENFQWLKISKDLLQVAPLNLKAADASYDVEDRFFDEGYLKFNAKTGIFIEKFNSGQHQYQLLNHVDLANVFAELFEEHFNESKALMN